MLATRGVLRLVGGATVRTALAATTTQRGFRVSAPVRAVEETVRPWYVLGLALADHSAGSIKPSLSDAEREALTAGFSAGFMDKADPEVLMKLEEYSKMATEILEKRHQEDSANLLDQAEKEEGAIKTSSGLIVKHVKEGEGEHPPPKAQVAVHYTGKLANGKIFDTSRTKGDPVQLPLDMVIPGWQEGIQMMKAGGVSKITIPANLGYGAEGHGVIPGNATLIFEIELVKFMEVMSD